MSKRLRQTGWYFAASSLHEPPMTQQDDSPEILTREVFEWMAEQFADGHSQETIFEAMLEAGWNSNSATRAMQILLETRRLLPVPVLALPVTGGMVDAGDRWVQVIHQSDSPNIVVFAGLLSDSECDALIEEARPRLSRSLTVDTRTGGEELFAHVSECNAERRRPSPGDRVSFAVGTDRKGSQGRRVSWHCAGSC